ncbi:response regulator [Muricoccus pecuniae]|uniref:DNA-binding response OmpR family regulator n=1 Tax=Muricoccus pecuniae TaxID=693023 RepID=A0A840Y2P8_9PROT|nr:response regulator [Roseomonas pecuniae]MBB5695378.1 DNA-binding response OmpR family regulator [Roseomonas pecuniae]
MDVPLPDLALVPSVVHAPETSRAGRSPGSPLPRRVLVVEDEWFIAEDIADDLRTAGWEVLGPVPSVADAVSLIEAAASDGGISVAVLDVNLQGERVTPVADALAAIGVPFLFATGYETDCDRGRHLDAPLVVKPCRGAALLQAVSRVAAQRESMDLPAARSA